MHIEHTDNDHIHHKMTRGDEVQNIQPPVGVLGTVMLLQFKVDVVHQRLHQHHGHAQESNRGEEDEEADEFVDELVDVFESGDVLDELVGTDECGQADGCVQPNITQSGMEIHNSPFVVTIEDGCGTLV